MGKTFTVSDFDSALKNGPYAWPGGYPMYFITSDGAALCFASAEKNAGLIRESIAENSRDGWRVVAVDVNWEDPELFCDDTSTRIPSAYAEVD